jgi:hypothetical protein
MCCCGCLLVAAITEARTPGGPGTTAAGTAVLPPVPVAAMSAADRVAAAPSRLCGWLLLPLRRWGSTEGLTR